MGFETSVAVAVIGIHNIAFEHRAPLLDIRDTRTGIIVGHAVAETGDRRHDHNAVTAPPDRKMVDSGAGSVGFDADPVQATVRRTKP